ncbi:MAG: hypothetical protein U0174_11215 [Polyangiaceae bacterium]
MSALSVLSAAFVLSASAEARAADDNEQEPPVTNSPPQTTPNIAPNPAPASGPTAAAPAQDDGNAPPPQTGEVRPVSASGKEEPLVPYWPEPWSDADPKFQPRRWTFGDIGVRASAEYRAQGSYIVPLALNSDYDQKYAAFEHRLRLDGAIDYEDKVRIVTSVDALEGVLWGDNGSYNGNPASTTGANIGTLNTNNARICVVQTNKAAPADPQSYRYGLCPGENMFVRRLYGEIITPIGLFRVGRQPMGFGNSLSATDGDGRKNRFGIAYRGNTADRVMFATKPLEALKRKEDRDTTQNKGLFLVLAYDHNVQDDPQKYGDDLRGFITAIRVLAPKAPWGTDVEGRLFHAARWDHNNGTTIHAFGARATSRFGDLYAGAEGTVIVGETSEVANAFRLITNDPPVSQRIQQAGFRAVVRYDKPMFTAYLESDFASGDSDPTVRTPLTQFRFAEDSNVGLLMFKHTLAYQTARAAAAGSELLRGLGATTIPVDQIASRGAFTNAFALFPQVDVRPIPNLLFRGGVLFAWAAAPSNDPIASQQRRDGKTISDDLVNFAGGKPGSYYGTEIDGRIQWRFKEHFAFDLEGAILFPGNAFQDRNGYAVRSSLLQGRTTFFF